MAEKIIEDTTGGIWETGLNESLRPQDFVGVD
jgi:hypothetical protein